MEEQNTNMQGAGEQAETPKRKVTVAREVKVLFTYKSGKEPEAVVVPRDIFSVIDALGRKLEQTKDKEEMDDILVSVHSIEDQERSDPLPEGEERWEGDYLVGSIRVEGLSLPDAMSELTKGIIPNDLAIKGIERFAEQLFLRSRLDAFVFIGSFDGQSAVVPMVSSFVERKAEIFSNLYLQMKTQAENLRKWVGRNFPDLEVDWGDQPRVPGIILPNGAPAPACQRKRGCGSAK